MTKKTKLPKLIFRVVNTLFFAILLMAVIIPMLNVVTVSLEPASISNEINAIHIIPKEITLAAYRKIFKMEAVLTASFNSVFITLIGTVISLVVSSMMAFGLSKKGLIGVSVIGFLMYFSSVFKAGIMPQYLLIQNIGLLDNLWAVILLLLCSPYNIILLRVFFQGIPDALTESATIEGANDLQIYYKLMLPLSKPILATVALFVAVTYWNAYIEPRLMLTNPNMKTLQMYLQEILSMTASEEDRPGADALVLGKNVEMAITVVATLPIMILYPFLQKYFTKGIMLGAVKG